MTATTTHGNRRNENIERQQQQTWFGPSCHRGERKLASKTSRCDDTIAHFVCAAVGRLRVPLSLFLLMCESTYLDRRLNKRGEESQVRADRLLMHMHLGTNAKQHPNLGGSRTTRSQQVQIRLQNELSEPEEIHRHRFESQTRQSRWKQVSNQTQTALCASQRAIST